MLLATLNGFPAESAGVQLFDNVSWIALIFASLLTVSMLPAAALAWHWTAPVDELED